MTTTELIALLQEDLKNERKHMLFYLHAASMVTGLHREEISEFLMKEVQDELKHVEEFSNLIVQLGAVPGQEVNSFPTDLICPVTILKYAQEMEKEVATNYAQRLTQTETNGDPLESYIHLFYEDQLQDSQKTALEIGQVIRPYLNKDENKCPRHQS